MDGPSTPEQDAASPRVAMLGMGWFPGTPGGLNRYYRSLFEQLPNATGVVIGPAEDAPASVSVYGGPSLALPRRIAGFAARARRQMAEAEVIDAHFALYAALPLLRRPRPRVPLVFHFHGPWAEESVAAGDGSRSRLRLRARIERSAMRRADAHVVLSSAFRRVLVERYRISPWSIHVWQPGVDLEAFTPGERGAARERLGLAPGATVAVCVRRLVPRMGIEGLLDAWERVAPTLPAGSTLLLAGDGPLREALTKRAEEPGLRERVRVLGRVTDEQLVDAYRAADVAVVPTLSLEGFGLVVLEAAACGTPSIVTDAGGLPEVLAGLDRSLVVPAGDVERLSERFARAATGELPSRETTRTYAERFSWPALGERHEHLYRRLQRGERDERPRVVYLDHVARLSGGEIALMRLLPRLRGVHTHMVLGEQGPLAERLQQSGVSVEVLEIASAARDVRRNEVRLGGAPPAVALSTAAYVAKLTARLRALRPDVVHTNSLKSGIYGSIAAKALGIPVVWHVRDRIAEDYIPKGAVRVVRAMIARLADGVIANSEATLATLHRHPDALSWVIPASVDPPAQARVHGDGPATFGMLGRIAPWKGQDLFLRAFASAFAGGEERAALIGTPLFGEQDYEHELRALADELGISERVEFRGFREDVWPELARLDVLVHASVIPEPFGTVVLEGMAAGLAVLAADEGGPAEVIDDGRTGRLFKSRDEDSLRDGMLALASDPGERTRLATAARDALGEYAPDAIAARLEEVYEAVLAARRH
ncbi:MAG TPA: glycosyltransferase family 4 protein [Solirubrobacteraceae bacterium]